MSAMGEGNMNFNTKGNCFFHAQSTMMVILKWIRHQNIHIQNNELGAEKKLEKSYSKYMLFQLPLHIS